MLRNQVTAMFCETIPVTILSCRKHWLL